MVNKLVGILLFNWPIFLKLLHVTLCPQKFTFRDIYTVELYCYRLDARHVTETNSIMTVHCRVRQNNHPKSTKNSSEVNTLDTSSIKTSAMQFWSINSYTDNK